MGLENHAPEPESGLQTPQEANRTPEELRVEAQQMLAQLDTQTMKDLADPQEQEFLSALEQSDTDVQEAFEEFKWELKALDTIEENFSGMENYAQFETFLGSGELSPAEMEAFLATVSNPIQARLILRGTLPLDRESYVLFADRFGIPTSTAEMQDANTDLEMEGFEKIKGIAEGLRAIPAGISPDLDSFRTMLQEMEDIDPSSPEFRTNRNQIQEFLLGANLEANEGWALNTILAELKEHDAQAVSQGTPSRYYESFTRIARDFSPEVARRIEFFEASYQREAPADGEPASSYQRAIIQGALPEGAALQGNGAGDFQAQLSDGSLVSVEVDGNHITRSVSLDGSNYQLETPIEQADFSAALGSYESVRQELEPKKARSEQALSFLENPQYADAPLADMQEGLLNILGLSLYNELGIRDARDKQTVIQMLNSNVGEYTQTLEEAKVVFEKALQAAVQQNRERYRTIDEQVKQTLRILKFSGLDSWDIDYLVAQIKSGFLVPDLGVAFNPQNVDPAKQNFGEPISETASLSRFTEYIYRFVNKGATGNPEGKDADGNIIGFPLDAVIRNPNAQLKTQAEIRQMMEQGGVWNDATGFNRNAAMENLKKTNTI